MLRSKALVSANFRYLSYSPHLSIALALYVLVALSSCAQKSEQEKDNGAFFNAVYNDVDQLQDTGNFIGARHFMDSVFASRGKVSIVDSYTYYYLIYNSCLKNNADAVNALRYADSMLQVIERNRATIPLSVKYAEAFYLKGDALYLLGNYKEAYRLYYQGREKIKATQDPCALGDYEYRIAMVLYKQQHYKDAIWYFRQCFRSLEPCTRDFTYSYRQQEVLNNIGLSYNKLHKDDSASWYYHHALSYIDEKFDHFPGNIRSKKEIAKAVIMGNLASVLITQKKYSEAEAMLRESIGINRRYGKELRDAGATMLKLAGFYLEVGKKDVMKRTLDSVRLFLTVVPDAALLGEWNRLMSEYFQPSDPALAFGYMRAYHRIDDSINASSADAASVNITAQLADIEARYKMKSIEKDRRIERNLLNITLGIAFCGFLLVIYVVNNLRRTRRYMYVLEGLNKDISLQKKELEETAHKLEISHLEKDKILRVVAHDLRSPVSSIYSLTEILSSDRHLTANQQECLGMIRTACAHALNLSHEILDVTIHIQAHNLKLETVNLRQFLNNYIGLLRFKAREKGQEIILEVLDNEKTVIIDVDKFGRVINNLITNAVKFSNTNSVIKVLVADNTSETIIAIIDQGIGIPLEIQGKIFDQFTEAKRYGTSGEKPYGMGLAITKQIIEAHNGRIWVESREGEGTAFYLSIPLRQLI